MRLWSGGTVLVVAREGAASAHGGVDHVAHVEIEPRARHRTGSRVTDRDYPVPRLVQCGAPSDGIGRQERLNKEGAGNCDGAEALARQAADAGTRLGITVELKLSVVWPPM
jgi:hypothetical protein